MNVRDLSCFGGVLTAPVVHVQKEAFELFGLDVKVLEQRELLKHDEPVHQLQSKVHARRRERRRPGENNGE